MKTIKQQISPYIKRLQQFDKEYFKNHIEPKNDDEIENWLVDWLLSNDIKFDKNGWKMIMRTRSLWPEFWFAVLEKLFNKDESK